MRATADYVLDASAILALIQREPGWERVQEVESRLVSTVNVAEVASVLCKSGYSAAEVRVMVAALRLQTVSFDADQAIEVGRRRPETQAYGLSLGDRACIGLASHLGLPLLTAEREWDKAAPDVTIERLR